MIYFSHRSSSFTPCINLLLGEQIPRIHRLERNLAQNIRSRHRKHVYYPLLHAQCAWLCYQKYSSQPRAVLHNIFVVFSPSYAWSLQIAVFLTMSPLSTERSPSFRPFINFLNKIARVVGGSGHVGESFASSSRRLDKAVSRRGVQPSWPCSWLAMMFICLYGAYLAGLVRLIVGNSRLG